MKKSISWSEGDLELYLPSDFGLMRRVNIPFPCNKDTKRLIKKLWVNK